MAFKPAVPLTGYQRRWAKDRSRFKIGCITRQGGKSFGSSLEVVDDCMERKTMWVLLSAGERQSKELIAKCAMHARAYNMAIDELEDEFKAQDGTAYKQLEIVFPNGSRIVGLPANPDTARGWSANILLDEFALHRDSREIWKAMFPTVTRGYRIIVISTFKGKNNKFYDLFYNAPTLQRFEGTDHKYLGERGGWSKHIITIHDAVEMGLELHDDEGGAIEPEDLRLALDDEEAWEEEYECVASDEASAFLTHDLITSVQDVKLNDKPDWTAKLIEAAQANYSLYKATKDEAIWPPVHILKDVLIPGDLYVGMDIGRRKDLSVLWLDVDVASVLRTLAVIEMHKMPFYVQRQVLFAILMRREFRRACIDETGIGMNLAESATDRFGSCVEGVSFTPANKEAIANGLKENFEDAASAIPAGSTIRNSLHSVKKYATATKHFRFDAEKSEQTGHADHFWAKGLSVQAYASPQNDEEWDFCTGGASVANGIMRGYR